MAATPVFPHVAQKRGHYESFYLRACHPSEPLGVWIRYTVHKRPGAAPRGSTWFTLWDPAPHAAKETLDNLSVPSGGWIRVGESSFGPGRAAGRALGASWELAFEPDAPPFRHLPSDWMYRAPVPRTKTESPAPAARFTGSVTVDGRTVAVDDWPGAAIGRVKMGPVTTPWIGNGCVHVDGRSHRLGGLGTRGISVSETPE